MTRPTNIGRPYPLLTVGSALDSTGYEFGQVPTATGSNGSVSWGSNVATITSNGSNQLAGPFVNFASGNNVHFSAASNTLTINAQLTGSSTSITANTSNTISPVNLASGPDITFGVSGNTLTIGRAQPLRSTIIAVIDGGGSTITTGIKGDLQVDFAGTIEQWSILPDQSGSIVIDIWKDTYANFPPTDADSITASAPPTLSGTTKAQSGVLTGWTGAFSAGDIFRFNVDSITTCTRVTLALRVRRTALS